MIFAIFSILIPIAVFAVFGVVLFRMISEWNRNSHSPRLTVPAVVVGKRNHTSRDVHCRTCEVQSSEVSTTYYATFQFESGDRLELAVPYSQAGYLIEGDRGMLTFQGTRFLGFERT